MFGYGGVQYTPEGVSLSPSLPPYNVTSLTLRGLNFADGALRVVINATHFCLAQTAGTTPLYLTQGVSGASGGPASPVPRWPAVATLPLRPATISTAQQLRLRNVPLPSSDTVSPSTNRTHSAQLESPEPRPKYLLFSPNNSPGDCSNTTDWVAVLEGVRSTLAAAGPLPKDGDEWAFGVHLLFNIM